MSERALLSIGTRILFDQDGLSASGVIEDIEIAQRSYYDYTARVERIESSMGHCLHDCDRFFDCEIGWFVMHENIRRVLENEHSVPIDPYALMHVLGE